MGDTPTKAEYDALVGSARLVSVMLTSSSTHVDHAFRGNEESAEKFLDEGCGDIHYMDEEETLLGQVQFRVWMTEGKPTSDQTVDEAYKAAPARIEARYIVAFQISKDHGHEAREMFFKRTAVFTAWPYFRSFVAGVASAALVEFPVLPIKQLSVPFKGGDGYADTAHEKPSP